MAHFIVLSINYAPEPTGFAPHATALADHLTAQGHAVTVCTGFPFAPRWNRWSEYRGTFTSRTEASDHQVVIRITHFIPRRPGSAMQRLAMEGTFCLSAAWAVAREIVGRRRTPDAVLYIGAQPSIAMLARLIAGLVGAPYFVNINDIATQAAADVGILRHRWLQKFFSRFEFAAYGRATGASVLCARFSEMLVDHGYPRDRIRVIRSPINTAGIRPIEDDGAFRARYDIPSDAFVVMFSGSMGLKQGLANVVAAAEQLKRVRIGSRPMRWVLVGDGETRDEIVRLISRRGLDAVVRVLDFQPESEMSAMFAAADLLLLNQVGTVKDSVIPSKLLTYMAAGKPVLAAVNRSSQGAEILLDADGGLVVAPDDPGSLARGAEQLAFTDPARLAAMGARNRAYAEQHFDERQVLRAHERFMLDRLSADPARGVPRTVS